MQTTHKQAGAKIETPNLLGVTHQCQTSHRCAAPKNILIAKIINALISLKHYAEHITHSKV